jgi:phosphoglycolate phosphatase (TIGR01487 family)
MDVRAVAVDIDGTLTDAQRRLHLGAAERVREVEALGVPVILATGNILCFSEAVSILIGTTGGIIAENGGIIKLADGEEVYLGNASEVLRAFDHLAKRLKVRKVARSELRRTEVAIYRTVSAEEVRRVLRDFDVEVVDTKFAIHIKDPRVSKGKALRVIASRMGIGMEEVVAIGDSENDRDMLESAGYAISVGEESLRDCADYVTKRKLGEGGEEAFLHVLEMLDRWGRR